MRGVPGDLKRKRTKTEQAIQDRKDVALQEIIEYIMANSSTYEQVKQYIEENDKEDWREVLRSKQRRQIVLNYTARNNYNAAKERNEKFFQWCRDNNYSISEGLDKARDIPEFQKIWMSSASINRLYNMERAEESKKAKEGKPNNRKPKKVRCLDDGLVFPSINKTAEHYGIRRTQDISDCCYGVIGSVKGLHFEFVNVEK